jgi:hypothetical protein
MLIDTDGLLSRRELNDGSQAIYCLEPAQYRIRPVGHGLILTFVQFISLIMARPSDPITPCPTGRFPLSRIFQAINCLATIIQPLRGESVKPRVSLTASAVSLRVARDQLCPRRN